MQPKMASAESKNYDQRGLESGLSYIGLQLEHGEQQIARLWSIYENAVETPQVNYPKFWNLKSEKDQREEVEQLEEIRDSIPSPKFQKEITKQMARIMLSTRISDTELAKIEAEIDSATVITSDPDTIIGDIKAGLLSSKTGSMARGYPESEYPLAQEELAKRRLEILKAQTKSDPAARGVPELADNPNAGELEKEGKPKRGSQVKSNEE